MDSDSPALSASAEKSASTTATTAAPPRRNFLVSLAAVVIGAVVGVVPLLASLPVLFDPLLRKKAAGGKKKLLRLTTLDALPADGSPLRVPVLLDLVDAWNREANQPQGAVFVRRVGETVQAFNAICPHAGCFVAYAADVKFFKCPCHNSAFGLDGSKVDLPGAINPSPRPLDELKVDAEKLQASGEVWVEFENYYPGQHEKKAKT